MNPLPFSDSEPHQTPLLEIRNLKKSYGHRTLLSNFNLTVNSGEFLTILGASGCGKTTLLRMIAGLEFPDAGSLHLEGEDITEVPAERRKIHTIFQSYALFPHMTVFENVAFGLRMKGMPLEEIAPRVLEAVQWVQLEDSLDRLPGELSGGQQQRVAIARAVVNRPKLLLLDECLSALDFKLRKRMQEELKSLQRKLNIPFVFVTHNQEEALSLSDRIIVLREGKIEQAGSPRELYEEPSNLFVANFIGEGNLFTAKVEAVLDEQRLLTEIEGKKCSIMVDSYLALRPHRTMPSLIGEELFIFLRPEDLRLTPLEKDEESEGLIGYVRERKYKGVTLDSIIELESGKRIHASEFFNEDDPERDHPLNQKVAVGWVESWEVVLDE